MITLFKNVLLALFITIALVITSVYIFDYLNIELAGTWIETATAMVWVLGLIEMSLAFGAAKRGPLLLDGKLPGFLFGGFIVVSAPVAFYFLPFWEHQSSLTDLNIGCLYNLIYWCTIASINIAIRRYNSQSKSK